MSINKKTAKIPRSNWVELQYSVLKSSIEGIKIDTLRKRFIGSDARVIQHEMDHLEGILFVDHLTNLKRNIILRKLIKTKRLQAAEA